jgi:hypothetical protein
VKHIKVKHTVKLDVTYEAFAQMLGYASIHELLEVHGSIDAAINYWIDKWQVMGLRVKYIA